MAADDYLSDREQEEALREWWRENWRWIVGGVVLGLAILGGWRYWQNYRDQRGQQAAAVYAQLSAAMDKREVDQASRLLSELGADHARSAYLQQGRLLVAKARVDEGKADEAIALLRQVSETAKDAELGQVARLRIARLLLDQGKHDEALALLDTEKAGAFAAQVREIRGDLMAAKGDVAAARAEYAAALAANADAQIDRNLVELKLQEMGGDTAAAPQGQP